jgi:methionyl-tRNA formyltransferase
MRIGFAGTPDFAATVLSAIVAAGYIPEFVLTQPDRKQGRGMKLMPSPVKQLAQKHGIAVFSPTSLKKEEARQPLVAQPLDVFLVAAYGLILPQEILDWPCFGCLNVHASLLPRWRGAAPIQRALLAGDAETGVTLMQVDAGLDSGAIISALTTPITANDTGGSLHDRLAELGGQIAVAGLCELEQKGELRNTPQPEEGVTYADKIGRTDGKIDWAQDARAIERMVRAFNPYPTAFAEWRGAPVKIWRAQNVSQEKAQETAAAPGTVCACSRDGIDVACGCGTLRLLELQPQNSKRMNASAYLAGYRLSAGDMLM